MTAEEDDTFKKSIKAVSSALNSDVVTLHYDDGTKKVIPKSKWELFLGVNKAKKISLKKAFPGPVDKPYPGLVIKTTHNKPGVILRVVQQGEDYLFDIFYEDGGIDKNLSWDKDYKVAYGDKTHGWSPFGDKGKPNQRHAQEVASLITKAEDRFGIDMNSMKEGLEITRLINLLERVTNRKIILK